MTHWTNKDIQKTLGITTKDNIPLIKRILGLEVGCWVHDREFNKIKNFVNAVKSKYGVVNRSTIEVYAGLKPSIKFYKKVSVKDICNTYYVGNQGVNELKRKLGIKGMMTEEEADHISKIIEMILKRNPEKGLTLHTINRFEMIYDLKTLERKIDI